MSNIHQPGGRHGIDDEFNYGESNPGRCPVCWGNAKRTFFTPDRRPRRGVTLDSVYRDIHEQEHQL